jgi:hypothetical protein
VRRGFYVSSVFNLFFTGSIVFGGASRAVAELHLHGEEYFLEGYFEQAMMCH